MPTTSRGDVASPSRLRVIAYVRVSPGEQHDSAMRKQLRSCRKWARANGAQIVSQHIDTGPASGRLRGNRPELLKAIQALQPGDALVVSTPDRLFRSGRELIRLSEMIAKKGCTIVVAGFGALNAMMLGVLKGLAEIEREYELNAPSRRNA
jgi:DNA invertase Pin-like site-specific DNA recombinase